jgi:hypothetical protein
MPVLGRSSVFKLDNAAGALQDLSSYITDISGINNTTAMIDTTTMGDASVEFTPGLRNGDTITLTGNYDATPNTHFTGLLGQSTSSTFEYSPAGTTAGLPKVSGECWIVSYALTSAVADVVKFSVTLQISGAVTWGTN